MVLYRHSLITCPTMPSPLTLNTIVTIQPDLYSFIPLYIVFQQDVVIPGILSSMIVPLSAMDTSKPINPTFLAAVKEHLHLVRTCIFLYSRLNWCLVYTCSLITCINSFFEACSLSPCFSPCNHLVVISFGQWLEQISKSSIYRISLRLFSHVREIGNVQV